MHKHSRTKKILCRLLGYLLSVGLPLAATLSFFPVWRERGGTAVLAGGTVLLIALCALPLWRGIKAFLRSPSVFGLWLFSFLGCILIESIIAEMRVICFFGFVGNLIGSFLFLLSRKIGDTDGK